MRSRAQSWTRCSRTSLRSSECGTKDVLDEEQKDDKGNTWQVWCCEGRAEFSDSARESRFWESEARQVCLQYVDNRHEITERYPANPNGAVGGLAGLTAGHGRVLVMMPHPERVFRAYQNPWRDGTWREDGPWMRLFRNARVALA